MRDELNGRIGKPYLAVRMPAAAPDPAPLEAAYRRAYAAARALWRESRDLIERQVLGNRNLHGGKYRAASVARWLDDMAACLASEQPALALFERFEKFTPAALADGTKNGATPPSHPFFEACEGLKQAHTALLAAYRGQLCGLRAGLLEYANAERVIRKRRLHLQSYDDLLLDLEGALRAERGTQLAEAIRGRYGAALIDEFQDTDPVQYRIFRSIYRDSGLPVFLVGDPKQSIYGFRGADIFAYLDARRDARHHHTLDVNWRSERPLLCAVNRLFAGNGAAFVIPEVEFLPSRPAPGDRGRFEIEGEDAVPFEFWLVGGTNGSPLRKEAATALAARATAAEIARLLRLGAAGKARIVSTDDGASGARPLAGGDVAVLVRKHQQARAVGDALRRLGIASVERGGDSVFETPEAEELQRVLIAIAEPAREPRVRAALATAMLGCSGTALHALAADEAQWEALVERFRQAHQEWGERGFIHMARRLFADFRVLKRLLAYADGERRVTNLLHVVELMHCATANSGIGAALEWLAEKRRAPSGKHDEELLRLESDENLVKILTVHAAKGLEFPLVFCPFAWDGRWRAPKQTAITFHDPDADHAAVLDFGSDNFERCRPLAEREELAEEVRVLYVALTRARYRCWMVWGNIRDAQDAAPAWLWHRGEAVDATAGSLDDMRIRDDLERIAVSAGGTIRLSPISHVEAPAVSAAGDAPGPLTHRTFPRPLRDTRHVTSFSALAHAQAAETPDYDGAARTLQIPSRLEPRDIHAFPRGARTGRCLHAIFEAIDFPGLDRAVLERV
ncbi:MAG TPA: UvrD-helicase domain-containing protein, partial [Burkholderiales bacterium]|nr:UvrD-helicase domain-containing protein [Burkholderiales bacterium]